MTEKDKTQVLALLGWNPDELACAAHENPAFLVVVYLSFVYELE